MINQDIETDILPILPEIMSCGFYI